MSKTFFFLNRGMILGSKALGKVKCAYNQTWYIYTIHLVITFIFVTTRNGILVQPFNLKLLMRKK